MDIMAINLGKGNSVACVFESETRVLVSTI